ncbi:hypothetical protein HOLleu_20827 [Holothuria leucospilota]|uniref:CCHC-type domain-containing protein n=1 Tax=Holothuria leucospilota TaxID=206669 RepID=A0A9Q1BWX7_HOLLE|nr:hypothetical protein HOLleu_20827 [Holothuria leucospilota]
MVLKGLPAEFKPFSTVITQKDKSLTFSECKVALRSFEETEKCSHGMESSSSENSVMKVQYRSDVADRSHKPNHPKSKDTQAGSGAFSGTCFKCGKRGHRAADCHSKKRWCEICKNHTHDTKWCRKRDSVKSVDGNNAGISKDEHSYLFKVGVSTGDLKMTHEVKGLLVDCGATTHVVNDQSKFIRFDDDFNPADHYIELVDGSRTNNVAMGKGDASITLVDSKWKYPESNF